MSFTQDKSLAIDELSCQLTLLSHQSGARVLHIGNDDPENLFCLAFRTLPTRSDGVAHILEHTVLCGSEKYPVKDPFFCMIRRSLNTFMNAMTADDMTFYPAASQVEKDFYNLLDVYCDAVFHPKLEELHFKQEGHRLEFATADDATSPLQFKGIVFNEMKGAMASPDARAWEAVGETLYPDTPYHFNSGGDPAIIPELAHQELIDFHRSYYHPSRCTFFFYGNLPLEKHLNYVENMLGNIQPLDPLPPIPNQPRFKQPIYVQKTYPIAADESLEEKAMLLFGFLTCTATDQLDILALTLLDELIMGTDAAPLKLALLKSGLCKEAYSGLDPDSADVPFLIFLKGCDGEKAEEIEKLLFSILKQIAKDGIAKDQIEGAIHQMEIERLEITGDSNPFGLTLFRRTVPLLMFGGNPEDGLMIHSLFSKLRKNFSDPAYLGKLIERFLLDNTHWCRVTMEADPKQGEREVAEELAKLQTINDQLKDEQKEEIIQRAHALKTLQDTQEDLEVLPKVTLQDIPHNTVDFPLQQSNHTYYHPCFTNGLVYASLSFDLPHIEPEDLPYARLLISLLPEVGCAGRDYKENLDYIQQHTGGVDATIGLYPQADNFELCKPAISVGGKALLRKADKLFPLLKEMITSADLTDRERIQELLMQHHSSLENSLQHNAMKYAINLAGSGRFSTAYISNLWYGLDYLAIIRKIAANPPIEKLQELQEKIIGVGKPDLILGAEHPDALNTDTLFDLPEKPHTPWKGVSSLPDIPSQGRIIASPVAFTCQMLPGIPYTHPDAPALSLATRLFNHQTLHREIREKGGAYGAGAANNLTGGGFYFYSYRDPHIANTLSAIEKAIEKVASNQISERELEEAKLTVIQKLDSPIAPGSRSEVSYSRLRDGKHVQLRQTFRDRLLSIETSDIATAVQTHLSLKDSTTVTFAGQELLDKENETLHLPLFPTANN